MLSKRIAALPRPPVPAWRRKTTIALLVTLATAPMLAGCVVAAGPGWGHGYWYHGHHYWYR